MTGRSPPLIVLALAMAMRGDDEQGRRCVALLERRAPRALSVPELAAGLGLERYDRRQLRAALESCVARGVLARVGKTRYRWVRDAERRPPAKGAVGKRPARAASRRRPPPIAGRYVRVRAGYGFVEPSHRAPATRGQDVLIPAGLEGAAMHGDLVDVELERRDHRLRRAVGRVVAVTAPAHERVVGVLERARGGWRVVPDDERLPPVTVVGGTTPGRADEGLIALVRITRAPDPMRWPEGTIERVLGSPDDPEVQVLTIALGHGLRVDFPEAVLAEAARLPTDPDEADWKHRQDLRDLPFVTIDGEDARDFDDAVSLRRERTGWRLHVAIADVSHYVRPGAALDDEAARRGTSVYFPDRAIPMLPARLSSELCSLLPDRPRLVLVAEIALDAHGHRSATDLYRAVIRSRARLTYTEVAAALADRDDPSRQAARATLGDLVDPLLEMQRLMRVLLHRRLRGGSLDLDLPEAAIDLDAAGRAVGVRLAPRTNAHRVIEELMLEANQAVAAFLRDRGVPFPYRVHEPPDPADVDALNEFLAPFGMRLDYEDAVRPEDAQRLLARLAGHRLARVLARQVLRSLKQAHYARENVGHFGLAFDAYCHFTSPIRRYPDLLVHRQLGAVLDGALDVARGRRGVIDVAAAASSTAERRAVEAERAMLDVKKAEFMADHLGEPHAGTIVAVTELGLFVELDAHPIDALVPMDTLAGGPFRFVEAERALVASRGRIRHRLGDRVRVEATAASPRRRRIELRLLGRLDADRPKPRGRVSARRAPLPRRGRGARRP